MNEQTPISTEIKHAAVINADGLYIDLVQVHIDTYEDGTVSETPQSYTLKDGEQLVYDDISDAI